METRTGICKYCLGGNKKTLHPGKDICVDCVKWMNTPIHYECSKCHKNQAILHPMFNYTKKSTHFSGATWACHRGCGTFTHWRIIPEHVKKVPQENWPTKDWHVELPKEEVKVEAKEEAKPVKKHGICKFCLGGNKKELHKDSDTCVDCVKWMDTPIRYECSKCSKHQNILHPMFKYTKKCDDYSGATWYCHRGCATWTRWKIVAEDLPKVPEAMWPTKEWIDSKTFIGDGWENTETADWTKSETTTETETVTDTVTESVDWSKSDEEVDELRKNLIFRLVFHP